MLHSITRKSTTAYRVPATKILATTAECVYLCWTVTCASVLPVTTAFTANFVSVPTIFSNLRNRRWKFLFFFNSNFSNSHGLRRVDGINGEAGPFQGWQFPAIQAPKRKKVNRIDRNYRINRSITFPSKFSISHNISPIKSHVTLASHLVKVLFRD